MNKKGDYLGCGFLFLCFVGWVVYDLIPKDTLSCAYIEWSHKGTYDTTYFYGQAITKNRLLKAIVLPNKDTIKETEFSFAGKLKKGEITAKDTAGTHYYLRPLKEGKCECDSIMDLYYEGKLPEYDEEDRYDPR